MIQNKKALSELVAYVILISITLSVSVLVFAWVKCYIPGSCGQEVEKCPDDVALVIKDYSCAPAAGKLNVTIQNKGLFSLGGFLVKVNDRIGSTIGVYTLIDAGGNKYGQVLAPGEEVTKTFSLSSDSISPVPSPSCGNNLCSVQLIEVQPFVNSKKGTTKIFCERVSSQAVSC